ncbi:hypothetical protein B0H14DRAFT_2577574 [Mycena olivaceomarginata]|nr:hypothetical protein B0H14DRAFT_2577574 [Mycena olivaceomarginata]
MADVPNSPPNSPHPSEPSPPRLSSDPPRDPAEPPERTAEKTRHVIDFELDDGDAAWEDEDEQLAGLGTTTHRSRNRRAPVIPVQKHRHIEPGVNVRATAQKRRGDTASKMQNLAADLDELEAEHEERAQALSAKHGMKVKETRRKASLYNAKISRIMHNLNEDRGLGERYKIPEADASMLEGFTPEEEEEMMADLVAKRKRKYHGKRANNLAASADAKRTVERLMLEITGLAERAGMIGFAMFTCGHIHDTSVPVTIQSWDALDFFREVLKKDPADISSIRYMADTFSGETGSDTLIAMQQECTAIIKAGLQAILGKTKVAMNYENYIKAIVEGKNIGLVGWPEGVDFKRMSKQSAIRPLRILRDALKCGTCKWKVLTAGEKSRLLAQFKEMVKNGEAHEKRAARERGSDDDDEEEEDESRPRKAQSRPKRAARERGSDDDDEQEEDESRPRKAIADMSVQEKRERLLSLARRARRTNVDSKRSPAKTKKRKRDERADDDDDERPTRKKHAGAGEDESSHPRRIRKRSDRGDGDEDKAGGGLKEETQERRHAPYESTLEDECATCPPEAEAKAQASCRCAHRRQPQRPPREQLQRAPPARLSPARLLPAVLRHARAPPAVPVAGTPTASSPAARTSTPNTDPAATAASSIDTESAAASCRQNVVVGKRGGPPGQRYIA